MEASVTSCYHPRMPPQRPKRLYDLAVIVASSIAIYSYCYFVSRHRILWSDELFGWMLITDPSWMHMQTAWKEGADGGGIVFYTLSRIWLEIFGRTVLSFRAFSATGCIVGLIATWFSLRYFYRSAIAAVALFLVWFGSGTILWQMIQTRFYGLLLGAVAVSLFAAVYASFHNERHRPFLYSALLFTFAANFVLVGTHPFGILYSAAILFGSAVSDYLTGLRRRWFYVASLLPWTLLLASREAMINSAKVGQPHFWTVQPHIRDLITLYVPAPQWRIILLLVIVMLLASYSQDWKSRLHVDMRKRAALLLPAIALALMPVLVWLISQRGTSYFVDRYLVPFCIGIAVLICEVLARLTSDWATRKSSPKIVFSLGVGALLLLVAHYAIRRYPRTIWVPPLNFTQPLARRIPPGIPVVIERPDIFDMMLAEQRSATFAPYYLLDWDVAIAPGSMRGLVSGYHEMDNWRRVGYFSGSILPVDTFLGRENRFIVLSDPAIRWLDQKILPNPAWNATYIGDFNYGSGWAGTIWLVKRR